MSHEPSTRVGDLEHSVKLMSAHALLARAEKVEREQPLVQGDMAIFEDRANGHGELLTASRALPDASTDVLILFGSLRGEPIGIINLAAMRTYRAIGPAEAFKVFPRLFGVAK